MTLKRKLEIHGYDFSSVQFASGATGYFVEGEDFGIREYIDFERRFKKCHTEKRGFNSFLVMDAEVYKQHAWYEGHKHTIHEIFWIAKHDGLSDVEAVQKQHDYAVQNDCMSIFEDIYKED